MECVRGFVPSNRATIRRREMNKILEHIEHRWPQIDKDTRNNYQKRALTLKKNMKSRFDWAGTRRGGVIPSFWQH